MLVLTILGAIELGRTEVVPESLYPVFRNAIFPIERLRPPNQPLSDTESDSDGDDEDGSGSDSDGDSDSKGAGSGSGTEAVEEILFKTEEDYLLEELMKG